MISRRTRCAWLFIAVLLLAAPSAARADRQTLPDTTWTQRWELPSGLRVVARHIPRAGTTSASIAYRYGSRLDPDGREGMAELVAEMYFISRAGTIAERRFEDLDRLRPSGWSVRVAPRITQLTESAPTVQVPGLLHQVAQRIHGVTPSDAGLRTCKATARGRLHDTYEAYPDRALHALAGELSAGRSSQSTMRYGSGEALDHITLQDVQRQINQHFKPANAVLCIAGNLDGLDLDQVIQQEFGDLPAAATAPPVQWGGLKPATAVLERKDLDHGIGILGIVAPALTDSLHPFFTAISFSAWLALTELWGKPTAPLTTRFQYSVASDPELVRMYPPLAGGTKTIEEVLLSSLSESGGAIVDSIQMKRACQAGLWLLGGPLPFEVRQSAIGNPATVHTIATTLGALESFGSPAFWQGYRQRFLEAPSFDMRPVLAYYVNRQNQVRITFKTAQQR